MFLRVPVFVYPQLYGFYFPRTEAGWVVAFLTPSPVLQKLQVSTADRTRSYFSHSALLLQAAHSLPLLQVQLIEDTGAREMPAREEGLKKKSRRNSLGNNAHNLKNLVKNILLYTKGVQSTPHMITWEDPRWTPCTTVRCWKTDSRKWKMGFHDKGTQVKLMAYFSAERTVGYPKMLKVSS